MMDVRGLIQPCGYWTPPAEIAETPFAKRRLFFEQHPLHSQERCPCPVCGYPTLQYRGGFDYCSLCHWEDDGQDDPWADEPNGGPNGRLTLKQARENFEITSCIYSFDEADDFHVSTRFRLFSKKAQREKRALRFLYDGLMALTDAEEIAKQWQKVDEQWKRVP